MCSNDGKPGLLTDLEAQADDANRESRHLSERSLAPLSLPLRADDANNDADLDDEVIACIANWHHRNALRRDLWYSCDLDPAEIQVSKKLALAAAQAYYQTPAHTHTCSYLLLRKVVHVRSHQLCP
jgi:hypothetical protein